MTPGALSSKKEKKRTETQESTAVKKRLTTKSCTEKRTAMFADEPLKRRRMEKTETKNEDVPMPMERVDSYLLNTVNTFLSDWTCALGTQKLGIAIPNKRKS